MAKRDGGGANILEGWQAGAVAVFVAAVVTAVIVPRSAPPHGIPPSSLTPNELDRARIRSFQLAQPAARHELPHAVELLSARLRALGTAEANGDSAAVAKWAGELDDSARRLLATNLQDLVALRAFLAREFAANYLQHLKRANSSPALKELGGATLAEMERNGWLQSLEDAPSNADVVLIGLFNRRFNLMVAPEGSALSLDPIEERAVLDFLIAHPPLSNLAGSRAEANSGRGKYVIAQIESLAKLEPSYPAPFAKGIVYYEMGQFDSAANAFDAYLERNPNGPHRLRAVNFLKASVEEANALH
jgi:hypothetical protein